MNNFEKNKDEKESTDVVVCLKADNVKSITLKGKLFHMFVTDSAKNDHRAFIVLLVLKSV